jgi:hypothetical protein
MHWLLGADEVSGESWQLVNAVHDESDGLILCEWHSLGYGCTQSCVSFGFAGSDRMIVFKLLLWSFLCNLINLWGHEWMTVFLCKIYLQAQRQVVVHVHIFLWSFILTRCISTNSNSVHKSVFPEVFYHPFTVLCMLLRGVTSTVHNCQLY